MRKAVILILTLFITIVSSAQVFFKTGSAELDNDLNKMNADARLDFVTFKTNLSLSYNISDTKIDYLSASVKMEPAEVYLVLELSNLSGRSIDQVVEIYKVKKEKGWGLIAKELGIKPGSPEFHKLKESTKNKSAKGKSIKNKSKPKKK
jgi:peptidyl-tRNA hydrolase